MRWILFLMALLELLLRMMSAGPSGPPVITVHPSSVAVTEGQTAEFSVTATGAPTLTYQWQVDDGVLTWTNVGFGTGGNTPTYTTQATTTDMSGYRYRCVVSNGEGVAFSDPATLTVDK